MSRINNLAHRLLGVIITCAFFLGTHAAPQNVDYSQQNVTMGTLLAIALVFLVAHFGFKAGLERSITMSVLAGAIVGAIDVYYPGPWTSKFSTQRDMTKVVNSLKASMGTHEYACNEANLILLRQIDALDGGEMDYLDLSNYLRDYYTKCPPPGACRASNKHQAPPE